MEPPAWGIIVQFLHDRHAEDERMARLMPGPSWERREIRSRDGSAVFENYVAVADPDRDTVVLSDVEAEMLPFILRHDPAHVLAEIGARRKLIRWIFDYVATVDGEWGCGHTSEEIEAGRCPETNPDDIDGLRYLAAVYAGHPDYREEWRP